MQQMSSKLLYATTPVTSEGSTQTPRLTKNSTLPFPFNPKSPADKDKLLRWCEEQWQPTFLKALQSSNALYFHECCFSFSRRGYSKLAGHPPLQSSPINKIPSFKEVINSTDLYNWLLAKLSDNHRRKQKVYFPAINRLHLDLDDEEKDPDGEEAVMLRKRLEHVDEMEKKLTLQIRTLRHDNEKLFNSTTAWYQKYQELLDKQDQHLSSLLSTPMKKKPKNNCELLDDIFG